jgi:rare lipoprotein A
VKTIITLILITITSCLAWPQLPEPEVHAPGSKGKIKARVQDRKESGDVALPLLPEKKNGWDETGFASWYGGKFQGRLTANGEVFDTRKVSAAHKTLPFNSIVRVTNLENGKFVDVRINDRGPYVNNRIIDLSMAAAEKVGMLATGVAKVGLQVLKMGDGQTYHDVYVAGAEKYVIQLGSYSEKKNAEAMYARVKNGGLLPGYESAGEYIRVILANIDKKDLDRVKQKLGELGIGSFIVKAVY